MLPTGGRHDTREEPGGSSGRTGQDLCRCQFGHAPELPSWVIRVPRGGIGMLINGYWEPGKRVAFPDAVNDNILRRLPPAPNRAGAEILLVEQVNWTQRILREHAPSQLEPDVILDGLTQLIDPLQHAIGAGLPDAALRSETMTARSAVAQQAPRAGSCRRRTLLSFPTTGLQHSGVRRRPDRRTH